MIYLKQLPDTATKPILLYILKSEFAIDTLLQCVSDYVDSNKMCFSTPTETNCIRNSFLVVVHYTFLDSQELQCPEVPSVRPERSTSCWYILTSFPLPVWVAKCRVVWRSRSGNRNSVSRKRVKYYQSFIYSPTDAPVSCLKEQYYNLH